MSLPLQYLPHLGVWRLHLHISYLMLWSFLSATLFVIGTCYIDQWVSLLFLFDILFIFYITLPVHCILCFSFKLRYLINDIKLDTVLTINKPLTKTSRAVARGKIWRFPFCAFGIFLIWMEHKLLCNNQMFIRLHVGFILNDGNSKYVIYDCSSIGAFEIFPLLCVN